MSKDDAGTSTRRSARVNVSSMPSGRSCSANYWGRLAAFRPDRFIRHKSERIAEECALNDSLSAVFNPSRKQDLVECNWKVPYPLAGTVIDGIGDRGRHSVDPDFADAL